MRPLFVLLSVAALASGCSTTAPRGPAAQPAAPPPSSDAPAATSADSGELEALFWARRAEARTRYTEADVAFMTGMIGHHAQALTMSRLAPTNGASPAVQRLAARIINAQRDEIHTMQRWLSDRGQPVPDVPELREGETAGMDHGQMDHSADGMDHDAMDHGQMQHGADGMDHSQMDHAMMDHSGMPGMLSAAQLDELRAARGVEFDRLFLRYMIQHHGGAVVMVDELIAVDGAAQDLESFRLAADVRVDQVTEIARMQQMLDGLPPESAPDAP